MILPLKNHCHLQILEIGILSQELNLRAMPMSEASSQAKWLCEIALKRLEAVHKDFDMINARAGIVIGFAGLFNSLLLPSWEKLCPALKVWSGTAWILIALFMLYNAFSAYQVTQVESIPLRVDAFKRLHNMEDEDARYQFASNVIDASDRMSATNMKKAGCLKTAILSLSIQIFLSLIVVIVGNL